MYKLPTVCTQHAFGVKFSVIHYVFFASLASIPFLMYPLGDCVAVWPQQSTAVNLLLSKDAHVLRLLLHCAANQQAREAEEEGKRFPSAKVCCQGLNAHCKYHLLSLSQAATLFVADATNAPRGSCASKVFFVVIFSCMLDWLLTVASRLTQISPA